MDISLDREDGSYDEKDNGSTVGANTGCSKLFFMIRKGITT